MKPFAGQGLQSPNLVEPIGTSVHVLKGAPEALSLKKTQALFSTVQNELEVQRLIKHSLEAASGKCASLLDYIIIEYIIHVF